eukprot:12181089-Alexandrium_andersonii.AAC.1
MHQTTGQAHGVPGRLGDLVYGSVGAWASSCTGVWVYGSLGVRVSACTGLGVHGSLGLWDTHVRMDKPGKDLWVAKQIINTMVG